MYATPQLMGYPVIQLVRPHRYNSRMMLHLCSTTQAIPHNPDCHMVSASMTRSLFNICSQSATPPTEVIKSVTWNDVCLATSCEHSMCQLIEIIQEGFPELPSDLPRELRPYHQLHENLTEFDGVCLYNDRVIIPPSLRDRVLEALQSAHRSVTMMCS